MKYAEKLLSGKRALAVFIGDSHTWGQGATGNLDGYEPPVRSGELRCPRFGPPNYVNLFRGLVNSLTGSGCAEIESPGAAFEMSGHLLRLQFECGPGGRPARILVDGELKTTFDTFDPNDHPNNYRILSIDAGDDARHAIEVRSAEALRRAECYSGSAIVINSGVGSCPVGKFLEVYWKDYVDAYQPDAVFIEAFSINDWLANTPIDRYIADLTKMSDLCRAMGAEPVLMTVSPIGGTQITKGGSVYADYVDASRIAAARSRMILSDFIGGGAVQLILNDNWHPNDLGHRIYFETAARAASLLK